MILDSDEFLFHQCNTHFHILIGHSHRTYCHMRRQSIPQYKHNWIYLVVIHLHKFRHFDKALIDFTKISQLKPNPNRKNVKPSRWTKMNTFVEIIAASSSFPTRVTITKVTPIYVFASSMLARRTSAMISSHMMQFFFMLITVHSKFRFFWTRRCPWTTRKAKKENASIELILIQSGF